jgi:hypothetical protein
MSPSSASSCDSTVCGADGDRVPACKILNGRENVACTQRPASDRSAQIASDQMYGPRGVDSSSAASVLALSSAALPSTPVGRAGIRPARAGVGR